MSRPKGSKNKPKINVAVKLAENTEIKNLSPDNSIKQEISSPLLIKRGRGRPALKNWICPHCQETMTRKEGIEHKLKYRGNCQLQKIKENNIVPGQEAESFSNEKSLLKPEDNQCSYKAICEKTGQKQGYNDICFNPVYCLNNFEGKCNLIIPRPIVEIKPEDKIIPIANIKEIKSQIRALRKLKKDLPAGNPERIKLGRQIKEFKKKLI
jgi:hypothetical protein